MPALIFPSINLNENIPLEVYARQQSDNTFNSLNQAVKNFTLEPRTTDTLEATISPVPPTLSLEHPAVKNSTIALVIFWVALASAMPIGLLVIYVRKCYKNRKARRRGARQRKRVQQLQDDWRSGRPPIPQSPSTWIKKNFSRAFSWGSAATASSSTTSSMAASSSNQPQPLVHPPVPASPPPSYVEDGGDLPTYTDSSEPLPAYVAFPDHGRNISPNDLELTPTPLRLRDAYIMPPVVTEAELDEDEWEDYDAYMATRAGIRALTEVYDASGRIVATTSQLASNQMEIDENEWEHDDNYFLNFVDDPSLGSNWI